MVRITLDSVSKDFNRKAFAAALVRHSAVREGEASPLSHADAFELGEALVAGEQTTLCLASMDLARSLAHAAKHAGICFVHFR